MSSEVSLDSVDFDEFDKYYNSSVALPASSTGSFHERIFAPNIDCPVFTKTAVLRAVRSEGEMKTQRTAWDSSRKITPILSKASGEAGVTYEWGGEGGGVSGYISGSAGDDNGNKAEISVEVNNDGSGSATVSVSHDEE